MILRPYSCGGMDDDRFMGKTSFRLIRNHPNLAVREAVVKALKVAGFDAKQQEGLPNEVVLYPGRTDDIQRRETHLATYEAYATAIRATFPGMASQMMAEVLILQSQPMPGAAPVPVEVGPAVERDRHGIPEDPAARAQELQTGEAPFMVGVDRHGFERTGGGLVQDWASAQAADAALLEVPILERETADAGPVQEVIRPPRAKSVVRLKKAGRPPAEHKADLDDE